MLILVNKFLNFTRVGKILKLISLSAAHSEVNWLGRVLSTPIKIEETLLGEKADMK